MTVLLGDLIEIVSKLDYEVIVVFMFALEDFVKMQWMLDFGVDLMLEFCANA